MNERSFAEGVKEKPDKDFDRRQAILDAAMLLFGELGFHGTTIPQVAERAGVAAGTIYRYFDSKEALVNAVFQREKEAAGRRLMQEFPAGSPIRQQFHIFWRRYAAHARDHAASFAFLELHHHAPYLDEKSREVESRVLLAARLFVEEAQRQQIFKPIAPAIIVSIVYGSFAAMVKCSRAGYLTLTDEELDIAERCVWEAIRA